MARPPGLPGPRRPRRRPSSPSARRLRAGASMVLALGAAMALGAGCSGSPSPEVAPDATSDAPAEAPATHDAVHEVEWLTYGGLCPEMPCGVRIVVGDEGTWSAIGYDAPEPASGEVPPGAATRLAETLETRWDALTAEPFTETCPTAYDGPEEVWRVRRLPAGSGAPGDTATVVRELASCTWDLDAGPAAAALEEVRTVWEELGLPTRW